MCRVRLCHCVICAQKKGVDPALSGKNKKYMYMFNSVELAMGKLIQLYLICVGEFLVCMQFNAKRNKNTDPDQTPYSVSSA